MLYGLDNVDRRVVYIYWQYIMILMRWENFLYKECVQCTACVLCLQFLFLQFTHTSQLKSVVWMHEMKERSPSSSLYQDGDDDDRRDVIHPKKRFWKCVWKYS